jgi:hypothetical protein
MNTTYWEFALIGVRLVFASLLRRPIDQAKPLRDAVQSHHAQRSLTATALLPHHRNLTYLT